jgi:hypothetical protein
VFDGEIKQMAYPVKTGAGVKQPVHLLAILAPLLGLA